MEKNNSSPAFTEPVAHTSGPTPRIWEIWKKQSCLLVIFKPTNTKKIPIPQLWLFLRFYLLQSPGPPILYSKAAGNLAYHQLSQIPWCRFPPHLGRGLSPPPWALPISAGDCPLLSGLFVLRPLPLKVFHLLLSSVSPSFLISILF